MLEEFKKFLIQGNMVDMAVGFIFGGAFATVDLLPKIQTSWHNVTVFSWWSNNKLMK